MQALGGKLVALKQGSTLSYVAQDHLTGTSMTTDASGNVVDEIKYTPYGSTRSGDIASTEKKFTGQRLDDTGLYYYGARYYDPALGRFVSADTIVPRPANPQSLNRYSYTLNNPLRYVDPSGHDAAQSVPWRFPGSTEPVWVSYTMMSVPGWAATADPGLVFTLQVRFGNLGAPPPPPPPPPGTGTGSSPAPAPSPTQTPQPLPQFIPPPATPTPTTPVSIRSDTSVQMSQADPSNEAADQTTNSSGQIDTVSVALDIVTVAADAVGAFPVSPPTFIAANAVSVVSSGLGTFRTLTKHVQGQATKNDLDVSVRNFFAGLIPGYGIAASVAQLLYDGGVLPDWWSGLGPG